MARCHVEQIADGDVVPGAGRGAFGNERGDGLAGDIRIEQCEAHGMPSPAKMRLGERIGRQVHFLAIRDTARAALRSRRDSLRRPSTTP